MTDLQRWNALSKDLDELNNILYLGLEPQRRRYHEELLKALQSVPANPMNFTGWTRLVPWRYTNEPLSSAGSLKNYGGRFNIGLDVDQSVHGHWPALYIAENQETAYREAFGLPKDVRTDGLTSNELALTNESSYSMVRLEGQLELLFDLAQPGALEPVSKVLARIKMPAEVKPLVKRLKLCPITMIRSASRLKKEALEANWRTLPVQFGTPSVSQILAKMIMDAGFEGIRYPSTKGDGQCVAVFPHKLASKTSFVQVCDPPPNRLDYPRLDLTTGDHLSGWDVLPPCLRPISG